MIRDFFNTQLWANGDIHLWINGIALTIAFYYGSRYLWGLIDFILWYRDYKNTMRTLADINIVLELIEKSSEPCPHAKEFLEQKQEKLLAHFDVLQKELDEEE